MAKIVKLHHNIDLSSSASNVMKVSGVAWGHNALQTITIARHTPFNPQQAVGYKGIVDYTSSPVTSDLTLDCIITEGCDDVVSVYNHAEKEVIVGTESYVLTSCNINFQAGNPATVNYGYITAGLASSLLATANPDLLTAGEEAQFAVVMGEDGTGVMIYAKNTSGSQMGIPPGAQTVGFTCSLNRNQILDVRSSSPVQFVTTYPLDLSMNLELLNKIDGSALNSLAINSGAASQTDTSWSWSTSPLGHSSNSGAKAETADTGKTYVSASGLKLTESGESINVGGNLTYTYNYTAADIQIPLE